MPVGPILISHLVLSGLLFTLFTVDAFEFPKVLLLQVAAVCLVASGLVAMLRQSSHDVGTTILIWADGTTALLRDPVAIGLLALLVSAMLSSAFGLNPLLSLHGSFGRYHGLLTLFGYVVLFFATRAYVVNALALRGVLWAVTAGVTGATVYGLLQLVDADPVHWDLVGRIHPTIVSSIGNRNFLTAYLVMAFPVVVAFGVQHWVRGDRSCAALLFGVAIASTSVVILALSRGAWLALLGCIVVVVAGSRWAGGKRVSRWATGVSALIAVVALGALLQTEKGAELGSKVVTRVQSFAQPQHEPRPEYWRGAVNMFLAHPLVGVGPDAFQLAFPQHRRPEYWDIQWGGVPSRAHNTVLHVASTQGALGLAAALVLAVGLLVAVRRAFRRAQDFAQRFLVIGLGAGLVGFAIQSLFGITVSPVGTLFVTWAAILSRLGFGGPLEPDPGSAGKREIIIALALGGAFGFALTAVNVATSMPDGGWGWSSALATLALAAPLGITALAYRVEACGEGAKHGPPVRRSARLLFGTCVIWLCALLLIYLLGYKPLLADLHACRGMALFRAGQTAAGVSHLVTATQVSPNRDAYWGMRGIAHHQAAARASSEERLLALRLAFESHQRAVDLVPENPLHRANLARTMLDLSIFPDTGITMARVREAFDEAIRLAPMNAVLIADAGRALFLLGDIDAAERLAERSLALHSDHALARSIQGLAALHRGNPTRAVELLEKALEQRWHGNQHHEKVVMATLAQVYALQGRNDKVLPLAQRLLELDPSSIDGFALRGSAHERLAAAASTSTLGEFHRDRARSAFGRLLDLDPGNAAAVAALGRLASSH